MRGFAWLSARASNVHAQFGEDGVLAAIFERIGTENKWCFEAGAADGVWLSNTRALGEQGWTRILVENDDPAFDYLQKNALPGDKLYHEHLERLGEHSLDAILTRAEAPYDIDLVSLDIDGGESGIWAMTQDHFPRVIVIEYRVSEKIENLDVILLTSAQMGYAPVYQSRSNIVFVRMDFLEQLRRSG